MNPSQHRKILDHCGVSYPPSISNGELLERATNVLRQHKILRGKSKQNLSASSAAEKGQEVEGDYESLPAGSKKRKTVLSEPTIFQKCARRHYESSIKDEFDTLVDNYEDDVDEDEDDLDNNGDDINEVDVASENYCVRDLDDVVDRCSTVIRSFPTKTLSPDQFSELRDLLTHAATILEDISTSS